MNIFKGFILLLFIISLILISSDSSYSTVDDCPLVNDAQGHTKFNGVFNNFSLFVDPVLRNGDPFIDWERKGGTPDPTSNTGIKGEDDISSGCTTPGATFCNDTQCNPDSSESGFVTPTHTCGVDSSAWFGFYDPDLNTTWDPSDNDPLAVNGCDNGGLGNGNEWVLMRMRLDGTPQDNSGTDLKRSTIWHWLLDLNGDGWNDFFIEANGKFGNNADVVSIFINGGVYAMPQTQTCVTPTTCTLLQRFSACGNTPTCNADDSPNGIPDCTRSYTRVTSTLNNPAGGTPPATEYFLDVQLPISFFQGAIVPGSGGQTLTANCQSSFQMFLSTSQTPQDPFLKDSFPNCNNSSQCDGGTTTPITLSYFSTESYGNEVIFKWTTGTETANAGFNLYYEDDEGMHKINNEIIISKVLDSLTPVDYSYSGVIRADTFYIADVSVQNEEKLHGPFKLGESYGEKTRVEKINWNKIVEEHNSSKIKRLNENKIKTLNKSKNLFITTSVEPLAQNPKLNILVSQTGIQRITFQELADAGFDPDIFNTDEIALTNRGVPVPVYFDPVGEGGGAIEFYGNSIDDSLYTETNVYVMQINPELALRVASDSLGVKNTSKLLNSYTETFIMDNNNGYLESAKNGDPWYDTLLIATPTQPASKTYTFSLENLVGYKGIFRAEINGPGDIPEINPDHHVTVSLNGVEIADELFEGFESKIITVDLSATSAQLINGENQLVVTVPGDLNAPFDLAYVDKFSISYQRNAEAVNDNLSFLARNNSIRVKGFSSQDITVYRVEDESDVTRLNSLDIKQAVNGLFDVTFAGKQNKDCKYIVSTLDALVSPELELAKPEVDINSGNTQYLIISHPDFIDGLDDLVAERQSTYTVKIVDLEDIITQYNHGIFDPQPIKDYITHAIQNMGTEYILLVGADTYDYKKYLNANSMSFIPTIYAATEDDVQFAPSDGLLADIDGDNIQDAAIGRFPVSTSEELHYMISKTLDYPVSGHEKTAVFSADKPDGLVSFSDSSETLISELPLDWAVDKAYIENLGVAGAKTLLNDSVNAGRAFTSFMGHSDRTNWTFEGLYNIDDVGALTNDGLPTVVSQYGCWNTYFVHPQAVSMAHKFLLNGYNGAAAVMGPSARTTEESDNALGQVVIRNIFQDNMTLGRAVMEAKQELKYNFNSLRDVIIGWVLLGDPALEVAD